MRVARVHQPAMPAAAAPHTPTVPPHPLRARAIEDGLAAIVTGTGGTKISTGLTWDAPTGWISGAVVIEL
jgi:hypothetical protein